MIYKIVFAFIRLYSYVIGSSLRQFGSGTLIKPFLNISNPQHIAIGKNVNIGSFGRITVSTEYGGHVCQSKNPIRLKIGNNVDIGNNSFISANNDISIGNHCILSAYVFISDHEHDTSDISKNLHQQPLTENGYVHLEDNVFVGAHAAILKNVTIGRHSTIGANAVVTKDVPPYSIAVGNPAKVIKKISH